MTQNGVTVPNLDVSYVSSLAWYFMIMFGTSGMMTLIQSWRTNPVQDDMNPMMMMGGPMMGPNPMQALMGGPDPQKDYEAEKQEVTNTIHDFLFENAEADLWIKWSAK